MTKTKTTLKLSWETPHTHDRSGKNANPDILVMSRNIPGENNNKWPNIYLKLNSAVKNKYLNESTHVSFAFHKKSFLMMFEPPIDIPSYRLSKSGKDKLVYNKQLINKIYDFFELDKKTTKYLLKISPFSTIRNKPMYSLEPLDYKTEKPI